MKFRLTPLNIVTALAVAFLITSIIHVNPAGQHFDLRGFYKLMLVALIIVTFISDLIFRFALKTSKKIWIIESIFIVISIILFLILQK